VGVLWGQRGDLWGLIQECADARTPFSEHRIMSYFCQICLALHHLQQRGILHRDLKTQNIFLSDHNMIKVYNAALARIDRSSCTFYHGVRARGLNGRVRSMMAAEAATC
jgi:serine/threonine protein kinase